MQIMYVFKLENKNEMKEKIVSVLYRKKNTLHNTARHMEALRWIKKKTS